MIAHREIEPFMGNQYKKNVFFGYGIFPYVQFFFVWVMHYKLKYDLSHFQGIRV